MPIVCNTSAQNILDVARIESGTISLERSIFNLTALISEILEDHRSFAKSGVQMQFDSRKEIKVNADRNRIAQVLFNILGNAVKVTEKGAIETTIERSGRYTIVIVRDSGPALIPKCIRICFRALARKLEPAPEWDSDCTSHERLSRLMKAS